MVRSPSRPPCVPSIFGVQWTPWEPSIRAPLSMRGITLSGLSVVLLCCLMDSPRLCAQEGQPTPSAGLVSVKDVGAKGDGVTDDSAAIQRAVGQFIQNFKGTAASGTIYFPAGTYIVRQPLILAGATGNSVHLLGAPGATLSWAGSPEWPMLIVYGSFGPVIEGLTFRTNHSARYAIHLVADNAIKTTLGAAVSPGSSTVTPGTMSSIGIGTLVKIDTGADSELVYATAATATAFTATFTKSHSANASVGGGAATQRVRIINCDIEAGGAGSGIAIGNILGSVGGTPGSSQVSEVSVYDTDFRGGTDSTSGIVALDGNNVGDVWIYRSRFFKLSIAIDFAHFNYSASVNDCNFEGSRLADIRVNAGGSLTVKGVYTESAGQFITASGSAGTPGSLTVISSVVGGTSRATYAITYPASLTLIGNTFTTLNDVAKVQVGNPLISGSSRGIAEIFSAGNYYQGASAFAPFYDGSNNQVLPSYYDHQPVNVASVGDYGGAPGKLTSLNNYLTASAITSQKAAFIPSLGLVRAGDTETAVAFRDHANKADVPGLAKDSSDVVIVGGTAGIGLNSAVQMGNGANGNIQAPAQGTGTGPKAPWIVVGWVPVKVGDSTYFVPAMK